MKNFDCEIFSRVIDYDLVKVARAAAILREDKKEAAAFIKQSLWYFVYDYMFNEKGQNIKIKECEFITSEANEFTLKSNTDYLLILLGTEANAQSNPLTLQFRDSKFDYDYPFDPEKNIHETYVNTENFHASDIINVKNNTNVDLITTCMNVAHKHYFMVFEYENLYDDLTYFPRENELFSRLISKPKRANHFATVDFSGTM